MKTLPPALCLVIPFFARLEFKHLPFLTYQVRNAFFLS